MGSQSPTRRKLLRSLVRAVSDLHPDVELVRTKAWIAQEQQAGKATARWVADERSRGQGTHDAYLVIVKRPTPEGETGGRDDRI